MMSPWYLPLSAEICPPANIRIGSWKYSKRLHSQAHLYLRFRPMFEIRLFSPFSRCSVLRGKWHLHPLPPPFVPSGSRFHNPTFGKFEEFRLRTALCILRGLLEFWFKVIFSDTERQFRGSCIYWDLIRFRYGGMVRKSHLRKKIHYDYLMYSVIFIYFFKVVWDAGRVGLKSEFDWKTCSWLENNIKKAAVLKNQC